MKTWTDLNIDTKGKLHGEIKTQCPQCSPHRKKKRVPCLNVNLDKEVFHCWHCEWKGTLKEGVQYGSNPYAWKPRTYTKPEYNRTGLPDNVVAWFKKRGITQTVLERNRIGYGPVYMPQVEDEVTAIQFPFLRRGEVVNIKYRDKDKNFRMVGGAERILYGVDDLEPVAIIVEGEMDKLSVEVAGFTNCISVPDGAPAANTKDYSSKFDYLEACAEQLEQVKTFILAVDNDEPGKKLEEELARRLGRDRCMGVIWPEGCKDANEVLVKHGAEVLMEVISAAKPFPVEGIYEVLDAEEQLDDFFKNGYPKGAHPGWDNVADFYTIQTGQWTVVTGVPSHGKSEWTDAMFVNLAEKYGWTFGVCSPENQPFTFHASKFIEKKAIARFGSSRMTGEKYEAAKHWVHEHFKFILPADDLSIVNVLEKAKSLVFRNGIKGLILDPWNEFDHTRPDGMSEQDYVSQTLARIRQFARKYDVHVFVIAHPTKLQKDKTTGEYPVPTPYDISGSAHWRNKADNCIAVWRDVMNTDLPVEVHIQKVRFRWLGKPGMANLYYDMHSGRYLDPKDAPPTYSLMKEDEDVAI